MGARANKEIMVSARKTSTARMPVTASTNERPKEGSSFSGRGRGSPTECAPHEVQAILKTPVPELGDLKPQQGQIVTFVDLKY
jgi:hypothetical protein